MIQSKLKPIVIKLSKMRLRYILQDMNLKMLYTVVAYDMKHLLVVSPKADRVFRVSWKDIELLKSEYMVNYSGQGIGVNEILSLRKAIGRLASSVVKK